MFGALADGSFHCVHGFASFVADAVVDEVDQRMDALSDFVC